jgi:hypothetical protein
MVAGDSDNERCCGWRCMPLPLPALLPLPLLVLRAGLPLLLLLLPRRLWLLLQLLQLLLLFRVHPAVEAAVTCPAAQITQPVTCFRDTVAMCLCMPILLLLLLLISSRAVPCKAYYSLRRRCCCCWGWCSGHRALYCSATCQLSRQQASCSLCAAAAAAVFACSSGCRRR